MSTDTNSGNPTYYFRGNVKNNYVKFAGLTWRIIRINEEGSIKIILNDNSNISGFHSAKDYSSYYSDSDIAKPNAEKWYKTNIIEKGYDSYVVNGTFCEQSKVKLNGMWRNGNATMDVYSSYVPNFKCSTDGNGKGIINSKVGLITYDEVIHAGGYFYEWYSDYYQYNNNYYLNDGTYFWTMSPQGYDVSCYVWYDVLSVNEEGHVTYMGVTSDVNLRPVINLNANVLTTGAGTSSDPYVIQTN